ncbi:MAG TPA: hypothetical protein DEQ77_02575 [Candidatus Omnitrophica bacterium]|nr:hypothetical protein [Candidatus Omnitrophota bacterium]
MISEVKENFYANIRVYEVSLLPKKRNFGGGKFRFLGCALRRLGILPSRCIKLELGRIVPYLPYYQAIKALSAE